MSQNLNKQWLFLIIVLVVTMLGAVAWEIYSIYFDETRETVRISLEPLPSSYLIPQNLKNHILD
ncbi:MAG: hypothetical protein KatS3mg085_186 [Candidatus Dojkabacteria bacterium]|nr:MAG: hypothetical protein KatS3mg085_186 [Candidatus Dojkabacteria bacterium]